MRLQVRQGVFESNSSSTHSLCICTENEFEAWKNGKLLFDRWNEEFVEKKQICLDEYMTDAQNDYNSKKTIYQKDWEDLTNQAKEQYCNRYIKENSFNEEDNDDLYTYYKYCHDYDLEFYYQHFTTPSNDKMVAFGLYGYDG